MRTLMVVVALLTGAVVAGLPGRAIADGAWLDRSPPVPWNQPRMAVPTAPTHQPLSATTPNCLGTVRPPQSDEDEELVRAGWYLIGQFEGGWGILVILGAAGFDGMCRPLMYQGFVFVDGIFAGTLSPVLMDSRTDGAESRSMILGRDSLVATFLRYTESDPLCCPSRISTVTYQIERLSGAPVLVPTMVTTEPTP